MRNSLLEVTPVIPESLSRLPELAGNLFFSWHRPTRALFEDLDPELWNQTVDNDGVQHAEYRERDPRDLPVEPLRSAAGEWLKVSVRIAGRVVVARLWK